MQLSISKMKKNLAFALNNAKRLISKAKGPAKVIPYPVIDALPIPRLTISPRSSDSNDLNLFPCSEKEYFELLKAPAVLLLELKKGKGAFITFDISYKQNILMFINL